MALTEADIERGLAAVSRPKLTHAAAAKTLGVTRVRVTQLVSAGELTDLTPEGLEKFVSARRKRQAEREAYKHEQREKQSAERQEILDALKRLDQHVLLLTAAPGAKGIAYTMLR